MVAQGEDGWDKKTSKTKDIPNGWYCLEGAGGGRGGDGGLGGQGGNGGSIFDFTLAFQKIIDSDSCRSEGNPFFRPQ
jgi:hypothetical protein